MTANGAGALSLVLGLGFAGLAPGLARAEDYPGPPAAAGVWRETASPNVSTGCAPTVLTLPAKGGATTEGPVSAILRVPGCDARSAYVATTDDFDKPRGWHGAIYFQSGRTLVSLRPDASAAQSPAFGDSLTLWLSHDACQLAGVQKGAGNSRVAIFTKDGCKPPPGNQPMPKKQR